MCAAAGGVLTCALEVSNTGNIGLTDVQLLAGAVNCSGLDPVATLNPGQAAVCMVQTVTAEAVVQSGGVVPLDYSTWLASAPPSGKALGVPINSPLSDSVLLSEVSGWTAPVYRAALGATIDPATCAVPSKAGMFSTCQTYTEHHVLVFGRPT